MKNLSHKSKLIQRQGLYEDMEEEAKADAEAKAEADAVESSGSAIVRRRMRTWMKGMYLHALITAAGVLMHSCMRTNMFFSSPCDGPTSDFVLPPQQVRRKWTQVLQCERS